jgi:hypothetical protein
VNEKVTSDAVHQGHENWKNDSILKKLLSVQRDIRNIIAEYKIDSGSITAMAHQARKQISNAEVRADFLELLIDLQGLGMLAKSRRILDEAEITVDGALSSAASRATARRHGQPSEPPKLPVRETLDGRIDVSARDIDQQVSDDFFKSLDHGPD